MNRKKIGIIACIVLILILISGIWVYISQPMSKKDVLRRVSHEEGAKYKAREIKIDNLQEKMGLQLFRVNRKNAEMGSVKLFFLANRLYSSCLTCFFEDQFGDAVCADYDGDGKYEFLYVGVSPLTSGVVQPTLYIYGMKGKSIQMEGVYNIEDNTGYINHYALKGGEDDKIYIYDEWEIESETEIIYKDGKWNFTGKRSQMLELEDITDYVKEYNDKYSLKSLSDY